MTEFTPDQESRMSRPDSAKGIMQRACLRLLRVHERNDDLPTNARFLFYELEHLGLVSKDARPIQPGCKMARRGDQELHEALTHLRDRGLVPWSWLEDETRQAHTFQTAPSALAYAQDANDRFALDRWDGDPAPFVLCEARASGGVLYPIAARYACPLASTNGQTRGFLVNEVAPLLQSGQRVLYLGDWDLCGNDIELATLRTLLRHAPEWAESVAEDGSLWERVALTTEQVTDLDARRAAEGLGSAIIRKRDDRFNDGNGGRGKFFDAVELEALGQGPIVGMLRDRLDELMPEPLDDVLEREEAQRGAMAEFLDTYR